MKRLLVNDCLSALPEHRTFWNDLQEWFGMDFVGGDYATLADTVGALPLPPLIVRNATWFPPITGSDPTPTISLLQDIFTEGPQREMQEAVIRSSEAVVFNSAFTASHYQTDKGRVIPLPVDFRTFEPGNPMGLQQELSLPDGCVIWVGASQGAAGHIKGYDIFLSVVRANPDIPFVAVFKDAMPDYCPPNMRMYLRLTHDELARVIGACRVGLCTSRIESQHLAGIEMGACGLPLVVPPIGTYWHRSGLPGAYVLEQSPSTYSECIRAELRDRDDPEQTRSYWRKEFDPAVIRSAWNSLIEEVEGA